jgi:hypothetical protein
MLLVWQRHFVQYSASCIICILRLRDEKKEKEKPQSTGTEEIDDCSRLSSTYRAPYEKLVVT